MVPRVSLVAAVAVASVAAACALTADLAGFSSGADGCRLYFDSRRVS